MLKYDVNEIKSDFKCLKTTTKIIGTTAGYIKITISN